MTKLRFDFSGKKTERVTFAAPQDLKETLEKIAKKLNRSISELVQEYVIDGAMRDFGKLMLMEARKEKKYIDMG